MLIHGTFLQDFDINKLKIKSYLFRYLWLQKYHKLIKWYRYKLKICNLLPNKRLQWALPKILIAVPVSLRFINRPENWNCSVLIERRKMKVFVAILVAVLAIGANAQTGPCASIRSRAAWSARAANTGISYFFLSSSFPLINFPIQRCFLLSPRMHSLSITPLVPDAQLKLFVISKWETFRGKSHNNQRLTRLIIKTGKRHYSFYKRKTLKILVFFFWKY